MKNLILALLLLVCTIAKAQTSKTCHRFIFEKGSIIVVDNNLSIEESFTLADQLLPTSSKYFDRYVMCKGVLYYRPGLRLFRKPNTYIVNNGDLIKLRNG